MNNGEHTTLRQHARVSMWAGDMSEEDIRQLEQTHMSQAHSYLNNEMESLEDSSTLLDTL